MTLYSYVVARDFGFAPNPFYGFCTLGTCKPVIRRCAKVGDWIVGTGSQTHRRNGHLVFAMQVAEIKTFDQYWLDVRFQQKKPNLRGSKKQAFGDNIYHRDPAPGLWQQLDSHHSNRDGRPNWGNISHDTQTDRVLISNDYIYWGGDGPEIPARFRAFNGIDLCAVRNHKNKFPTEMVIEFVNWLRSLNDQGYCGKPRDWSKI